MSTGKALPYCKSTFNGSSFYFTGEVFIYRLAYPVTNLHLWPHMATFSPLEVKSWPPEGRPEMDGCKLGRLYCGIPNNY